MSIQSVKSVSIASGQPTGAEERRLRKVCADFESIFVSYMLKSMRSSIGESGLFGKGLGAETYQSLFDSKLAEKMSEAGGFGIGEALYRDLRTRLDENHQASLLKVSHEAFRRPGPSSFEDRIKPFEGMIQETCQKYGLEPALVKAVIKQESYGDVFAVSHAGAKGLMQLMDEVAAEIGIANSFNPRENIEAGIRYLRQQLDRFDGRLDLALAAYNAGPGAVEKYGGIPPYAETEEYVRKVLHYAREMGLQVDEI